jgi:FKBP-type peptidyl-prolyl cis-trans isomerase FklB
METTEQKVGYALGRQIGGDFATQEINVDAATFFKGFESAFKKEDSEMTEAEMNEVMMAFQQEMMAKQQSQVDEAAKENVEKGKTYLADNAKKDGVITLDSGLQYKVLTEGNGKMPAATDTVVTHYEGTLIDGTVFDSSIKRGEPISFPVNGVIKGWQEALQLMTEGSKWELFVPAELAYGPAGSPPVIGPHATLVFTVELLEVK